MTHPEMARLSAILAASRIGCVWYCNSGRLARQPATLRTRLFQRGGWLPYFLVSRPLGPVSCAVPFAELTICKDELCPFQSASEGQFHPPYRWPVARVAHGVLDLLGGCRDLYR